MDPAPSWGGDSPEKQYKEYHRNLLLWLVEAEARLPTNLIGKRIIDSIPLGSKLSALVAHLAVEEICAENGHRQILRIIEEAHEYLKDQRLEQAFDEAIFKGRRDRGTSLTTFLTNKKAAFAELKKQGLDLLATSAGRHLLGHLILRQGAFSQDQRQRLKVVTNGSIDFKELEKAIQKVFGDRLDEHQHADHPPTPRRWRSASYWGEDVDEDWEDEELTYTAYEIDDIDPFEDLMSLSENHDTQLAFYEELPVVMDESDALEAVAGHIEDVFYEVHNRLHSKGKGKGKKGKGKSPSSKTYGMGSPPSFGHGKGGGYLEHRRLLQASRNGRGYDKPWMHRSGSKLTLSELKAKTRCHQCKQVGHWSKECPHRSKHASPTSRSSSSTTGLSAAGMSAGFFVQPPATTLAGGSSFLTKSSEAKFGGEYMPADFAALTFCFLAVHEDEGTALVDTAAQHGLVGKETLLRHDHLLQEHHGLQVQWSHEAGGSVRGVCGQEETTSIAYVPIGIGQRSGVLRVQVVPGNIPFLLPAYFLTSVGAVIDMEHSYIVYTKLGTSQHMKRLATGHVAVSIVDFGKSGFNVPANFAAPESQAWSVEPVPDWATVPWPADWSLDAHSLSAMGALAPLVAALVFLGSTPSMAGLPRSASITSTSRSTPPSTTTPTLGGASFAAGSGRTKSAGASQDFIPGGDECRNLDDGTSRGSSTTSGNGQGQWQIPGACAGAVSYAQPSHEQARCQPPHELPRVHRVQTTPDHAADARHGIAQLEQHPVLHPGPLLPEDCSQEQGQGIQAGDSISEFTGATRQTFSFDDSDFVDYVNTENRLQDESSAIRTTQASQGGGDCTDGPGLCGSGFMARRGSQPDPPPWKRSCGASDDRRSSCGSRDAPARGTVPVLRHLSSGRGGTPSPQPIDAPALEVRQPQLSTSLGTIGGISQTGSGSSDLPTMPEQGDASDCPGRRSRERGDPVHGRELQLGSLSLRDANGLCQDRPLQRESPLQLNGWLKHLPSLQDDQHFQELAMTLDIDQNHTYVATSCGDVSRGVAPVLTGEVLSRKIVMTKDGSQWNAVHVTQIPGEDYSLGASVSFLTLYEFTKDFIGYVNDTELYEQEITLAKTTKNDLMKSLDDLLPNYGAYWTLW